MWMCVCDTVSTWLAAQVDTVLPQTLINMFYSKSFERNIYLVDYFIEDYISWVLELSSGGCVAILHHIFTE